MILKEDYYSKLSHDFHAAYNFQILVSSGLITMYGVYQDRADFYTFEPMVDTYYKYYYFNINWVQISANKYLCRFRLRNL